MNAGWVGIHVSFASKLTLRAYYHLLFTVGLLFGRMEKSQDIIGRSAYPCRAGAFSFPPLPSRWGLFRGRLEVMGDSPGRLRYIYSINPLRRVCVSPFH